MISDVCIYTAVVLVPNTATENDHQLLSRSVNVRVRRLDGAETKATELSD